MFYRNELLYGARSFSNHMEQLRRGVVGDLFGSEARKLYFLCFMVLLVLGVTLRWLNVVSLGAFSFSVAFFVSLGFLYSKYREYRLFCLIMRVANYLDVHPNIVITKDKKELRVIAHSRLLEQARKIEETEEEINSAMDHIRNAGKISRPDDFQDLHLIRSRRVKKLREMYDSFSAFLLIDSEEPLEGFLEKEER